jgi:hypothetical protein
VRRPERRAAAVVLPAVAVALACAVAASLLFERLFRAPPPPPPPAPAAAAPSPPPAPRPSVVEVAGAVEREDADGHWRALHVGEDVEPDAAIRTGERSSASVAVGPTMRVKLDERTTVRVRRPAQGEQRLTVMRGRVDVDAPAEPVRVDVAQGGAVARARDARFSVLATETGVAVAGARGVVALAAAGGEVEVVAGEASVVRGGAAPTAPERIPAALLLRVARGAAARDLCQRVAGRSAPGAEVRVNGELVPTAADGSFVASLPRRRRARVVVLAVRDASGRRREETFPCEDDDPEIRDLRVRWR